MTMGICTASAVLGTNPKRFHIEETTTGYCRIRDTKNGLLVKKGPMVLWLPRDKAQRIAGILNEGEKDEAEKD